VALRHESRHRDEYRAWWGPKLQRYDAGLDADGDYVPDAVEGNAPGFKGCSPQRAASCPGRPDPSLPDTEATAYRAGWRWPPGAATAEDWACPGKQCGPTTGTHQAEP
jgi:hypothetical protein